MKPAMSRSRHFLLRRYICNRLSSYYAQPAHKVIGSIDSGFISRIPSGIQSVRSTHAPRHNNGRIINFQSLWGEWHWKRVYKRVYKEQQGMWLTPCELFTPYYSNVLANFAAATMQSYTSNSSNTANGRNDGLFEIVEIGGGRGTNAKALLNHLNKHHPNMYDRLHRYTIFDTSRTLHELQREVLLAGSEINSDEPILHADKIKLVNLDMMDVAEGNSPFLSQSEIPTVLIALELLDNLPHDKIGRCIATNAILQAKVVPVDSSGLIGHDERELHHIDEINEMQSTSNIDITRQYTEEFSPMNDDPLLQRILSIAPNLYTPMISHGPRWIPTVALGVLMKLFECRPNSSVAFADFDWLPPPDVGNYSSAKHHENDSEILLPGAEPAIGDPLVTDMEGNDHLSYLTSPPDALCDILFPSDFGRLAAFIKQYHASIANSDIDAKAMKQSDFLMKYGSTEVNKTKSWLTGYSPLINDFGNCSVLTVIPQHRTD